MTTKTKRASLEPEVQEILERPYTRRLTPDVQGGYTATIQEFPGCVADGESADEALKNLIGAAGSWISAQLSLNQPIPDPISLDRYSGKMALRIPRGLHKQAAELAAMENASLNQFITAAVSNYVGQKSVMQAIRREVLKVQKAIESIRSAPILVRHYSEQLTTNYKHINYQTLPATIQAKDITSYQIEHSRI